MGGRGPGGTNHGYPTCSGGTNFWRGTIDSMTTPHLNRSLIVRLLGAKVLMLNNVMPKTRLQVTRSCKI